MALLAYSSIAKVFKKYTVADRTEMSMELVANRRLLTTGRRHSRNAAERPLN